MEADVMGDQKALLVIDLQQGVGPLYDEIGLLTRVEERINEYHNQNLPVIFIQQQEEGLEKGTVAWQLKPQLNATSDDYYIDKMHADSFYQTKLSDLLEELQVGQLEICGAEIPYCIDATIKAGFDRGYKIIMKHDLVSMTKNELIPTVTLIKHYEQVWNGRFVTYLD
jgi:nicotinamidase-related amidase